MKIKELEAMHFIKSAFAYFKRNKTRTFLTSLGIMIGVLSVVMLIALGLGLKNYLREQFEGLGANLVIVFPGNVFGGERSGSSFGAGFAGGAEFDERDVANLKRISEIDYVVPVYFKSSLIESDQEKWTGYIQGTSEDIFKVLNLKESYGKLLDKSDISSRSKNVVLGEKIATELFGEPQDAVGRSVKMENQRFKVVGVIKAKGDREMDNSVIMSYKTSFGSINPKKTFFTIYLGISDKENVANAKKKAEEVLLTRYSKDDFSVTEQSEILSTVNQIFNIVNSILVAIGSISLIVGGVGIMNIMYASVTERTKEVGIRRAIGATKRDILLQFLTESVILSLSGGILGLLLAVVIVLIVRFFFPASINLFSVVITFLVSSGIGVFFGVFPARKAANLPPIEAIRYE